MKAMVGPDGTGGLGSVPNHDNPIGGGGQGTYLHILIKHTHGSDQAQVIFSCVEMAVRCQETVSSMLVAENDCF
jgi:hypothetical protein